MNLVIVRLIKKRQIYNFILPTEISGNYWITDTDYLGNQRNLINVEEYQGHWKIKSDFETKIMNGDEELKSAILEDYHLYFLKVNTDNEYVILYCSPSIEKESVRLQPRRDGELLIGNDSNSAIYYAHPLVSKQHARLIYNKKQWIIQDLNSKYGTYVNNASIGTQALNYGDIVFIMGLKLIIMPDFIVVNNIGNLVSFDNNTFEVQGSITQELTVQDNPEEEQIEFFKEEDYFYRAPRFKTMIEDANIRVDGPPGKQEEDKTPAIFTVGPMITMSMMSMTMVYSALQGVIDGTKDIDSAMPTLVMGGAMMLSMLLLPLLNRAYQKRQKRKREALRQTKYIEYINQMRDEIKSTMNIQRQILIDNYLQLIYSEALSTIQEAYPKACHLVKFVLANTLIFKVHLNFFLLGHKKY